MDTSSRLLDVPAVIYGTAFKFDDTARLVENALRAGFRAIDTSGNRPQYREPLVGQGISAAIKSGAIKRDDLYIQTKFSPHKAGKDPALYPYDTSASIPEQVQQSISSSLANLGVDYIDCLILHSLYPRLEDTLTAWQAMETFVPSKVSFLGLSNVDTPSLRQIYEAAKIKPISVQNRFTADTAVRPEANLPPGLPYPAVPYDLDIRKLCEKLEITYVPWGVLWGNPALLDDDPKQMLDKTAMALGVSMQVAWYACLRDLGGCKISILCGTTKEERMHETLAGMAKLYKSVENSESHRETWASCTAYIRALVNDD